jgi:hypothetical protein
VGADLDRSWAGHEPAEMKRFRHFRHMLPVQRRSAVPDAGHEKGSGSRWDSQSRQHLFVYGNAIIRNHEND